ncbi:MFS transporter [Microlunatus endophyticus]|uniref:MFS transporter n=1 Tax=Microlunatus endophyticus TaxID=1716077 RepID=A0A917WAE7_9ACTN|nr:MFS transporter [Microlunatus endophyticus]GGL84049.1 MFS transporter [Microlunatus endophyticus]
MIRSFRTPASTPRHNLNRLWFAQSTSLVGLQTGSVAVPLLAVDVLHADASQVALIGTLSSIPWLIAPVIGTIADRANRKQLLVVSHFGRALLWLTVPAAYLLGVLTLQQLWLVSAMVGLLSVVFAVGYRTFLPTIVPAAELGAANGKMGGTDATARAIGPAFAGYLIQLIGAVWTVLVQTMASLLAGVSTAAIRSDRRTAPRLDERAPRLTEWWRSITDGFACVYRIKPLRWLTLGETAYLFFFDVGFAIITVFFRTTLELTPTIIGVIFSVGSLGGILGATMATRLRAHAGFNSTVKTAAVLRGIGIAILPLSLLAPSHTLTIAVLIAGRGINACAWSVYEVLTDTYQQTTLPDNHRGSATAASLWLGNGASTIGAALAAALATTISTTALLTTAGIGAAAAGGISLLVNTTDSTGQADEATQPELTADHDEPEPR